MNPLPWAAYLAATVIIRTAVLVARARTRFTRSC